MSILQYIDFYNHNQLVSIIDMTLGIIYLGVLVFCAITMINFQKNNK